MARYWPVSLPVPTGPGYQLQPVDPFLRTDVEVGSARQRRLTLARADRVQAVWRMTPDQFTAFRAWFEDAPWSLAGDSDDLSGWARQNVTWAPGLSLVPGTGIAAGRMLETAATGEHGQSLAIPGLDSGATAFVTVSARAAGRSLLRLTLTGRDGTVRACDINLTAGTVAWQGGASALRVVSRGEGLFEVLVEFPVGIGASVPVFRLSLLQAAGVTSYAGNITAGVDLAELNLRASRGLYLPTGPDGNVSGAAGGGAWALMPVWTEGRVAFPQECRFEQMWSVAVLSGLNVEVSAPLEVRHA